MLLFETYIIRIDSNVTLPIETLDSIKLYDQLENNSRRWYRNTDDNSFSSIVLKQRIDNVIAYADKISKCFSWKTSRYNRNDEISFAKF